MTVNINIKRKFKINGKEYSSIEEMPENIRLAVEKAMASNAGAESMITSGIPAKVVFNGTEYNSIDNMPQDVRSLYEKILQSSPASGRSPEMELNDVKGLPGKNKAPGTSGPVTFSQPTKFESSFSARTLILCAGLLALVLLFIYLWKGR